MQCTCVRSTRVRMMRNMQWFHILFHLGTYMLYEGAYRTKPQLVTLIFISNASQRPAFFGDFPNANDQNWCEFMHCAITGLFLLSTTLKFDRVRLLSQCVPYSVIINVYTNKQQKKITKFKSHASPSAALTMFLLIFAVYCCSECVEFKTLMLRSDCMQAIVSFILVVIFFPRNCRLVASGQSTCPCLYA